LLDGSLDYGFLRRASHAAKCSSRVRSWAAASRSIFMLGSGLVIA